MLSRMSESEAGRAGGPFLPVRAIATLLDLTERRLQQLVKEGWIPEPLERGKYSLPESVRGYIRFLKSSSRDYQRGAETSRLAAAQAMRVEMENFRRMGELQTTEQVIETCSGLVMTIKSAHAGLPGRLASEFASITDPPRIHRRIQDELRAVDSQCADFLEKRAAALEAMPDPRANQPTVTADDAESVGGTETGDAT